LLNYFGLTDGSYGSKKDKNLRVFTVCMIALFENIPQLIIVICEIFYLKQSVTFVQAGNPIFGLFMTYKAIALELGKGVKKTGLNNAAIFFLTLLSLPQVFVTR